MPSHDADGAGVDCVGPQRCDSLESICWNAIQKGSAVLMPRAKRHKAHSILRTGEIEADEKKVEQSEMILRRRGVKDGWK
jgi:hypothetical protein